MYLINFKNFIQIILIQSNSDIIELGGFLCLR